MSFASIGFLAWFLPLVLLAQTLLPWRNATLLVASLGFYAWGDPAHLPVLLFYIVANWEIGRRMGRSPARRALLWLGLAANLLPLVVLKYAAFLAGIAGVSITPPGLPLGVSFFAFQGISYLVDIHRGLVQPQRRLWVFALYKALFPVLIAGPILRYREVATRLLRRRTSLLRWRQGMVLFAVGLGQKVLIADSLARPADQIFALPAESLGLATAWLGVVCYHLQLFFDFSGYSTMAIGIGHMLGLRFPANFNRPYISRSVTEFWRRWHMTLSSWFRDYVYIPLGGNRGAPWRTTINLLVVFALCGLWHGAAWTFVLWGLYQGTLMLIERAGFAAVLAGAWRPLQHLYLTMALLVGWAMFRADSFAAAAGIWRAMAGLNEGAPDLAPAAAFLPAPVVVALVAGAVLATQRLPQGPGWVPGRTAGAPAMLRDAAAYAAVTLVFVAALVKVASGTLNPFIYWRF